jgi:hypothetical protein
VKDFWVSISRYQRLKEVEEFHNILCEVCILLTAVCFVNYHMGHAVYCQTRSHGAGECIRSGKADVQAVELAVL